MNDLVTKEMLQALLRNSYCGTLKQSHPPPLTTFHSRGGARMGAVGAIAPTVC